MKQLHGKVTIFLVIVVVALAHIAQGVLRSGQLIAVDEWVFCVLPSGHWWMSPQGHGRRTKNTQRTSAQEGQEELCCVKPSTAHVQWQTKYLSAWNLILADNSTGSVTRCVICSKQHNFSATRWPLLRLRMNLCCVNATMNKGKEKLGDGGWKQNIPQDMWCICTAWGTHWGESGLSI